MALALTLRTRSEVVRTIAGQLRAQGSPDMVVDAVIAAHLRASCEIDAAREGQGLHTSRLVETATRNVAGLVEASLDARALVHGVLDQLERTGDLVRFAGGYWQTTPERVVMHPNGAAILLGAATARLDFVAEGAVRYLLKTPPPDIDRQPLDDWLGWEDAIEAWMAKALRAYAGRLQASGVAADDLQLYAPDAARQSGRASWRDADQVDLTGVQLRLCRASADKAAIYNRPYFLGEFVRDAGGVRLLRAVRVAHNHARRFRFGFDGALSVPRRIRYGQADGLIHMTIANDLPSEEERVLSLGRSAVAGGSPAVRRMTFPVRAVPFVAHAFERLGMTLAGGTQ